MDRKSLFDEADDPDLKIFFENFHKMHKTLGSGIQSRLNRSLPFSDEVFDRWERAKECGFEKGVSIYDSSYVFGEVKVGENTWIGPFTILDGSGNLNIGRFCSISSGVQIYTHDTVMWALSGGQQKASHASVSVGDNCYIGPNVIISKGVEIGKCTVIGANSFVNKSIPPFSIAFGTPARVVGKITIEEGNLRMKYFE